MNNKQFRRRVNLANEAWKKCMICIDKSVIFWFAGDDTKAEKQNVRAEGLYKRMLSHLKAN